MLFKGTTAHFASAMCQRGEGTETLFVELLHLHQSPKIHFLSLLPVFPTTRWPAPGAQLQGARELFGRAVVWCACLQLDTGNGPGLQISCNKSEGSKLWQELQRLIAFHFIFMWEGKYNMLLTGLPF